MVLTEYTSGGPMASSYNITLVFQGSQWSQDLQQAFISASDYLTSIIIGDIENAFADFGDGNGFRQVDDLEISATLGPIDGQGGVLAQAGPTYIRPETALPIYGEMTFDGADAQVLFDGDVASGANRWTSVVMHEMLHVIGFGSLWETMGLINNIGTTAHPDFRYTGQHGVYEYQSLYPAIYASDLDAYAGVPVESSSGSSGTDASHWDEATFDDELMTGYIDSNNTVSNMTIAVLKDMGYATTYAPSCFCTGTLIQTPHGFKPIETLSAQDRVVTLDRGDQQIRLVSVETFSQAHMAENERHRPIRIKQGALGQDPDLPPLYLSPQHRIYVTGRPVLAELGELSALVPIKDALEIQGIRRITPSQGVTYYHLIMDHHNIINANGIWCESFLRPSMMPARKFVEGKDARKLIRKLRHSLQQSGRLFAQDPYLDASIAIRT